MKALAAALLVSSCCVHSMAWPVTCGQTRLADLDRRYTDELYDVKVSGACIPYDDILSECPAYHAVWRHYWQAKRALDKCESDPAGSNWVKS